MKYCKGIALSKLPDYLIEVHYDNSVKIEYSCAVTPRVRKSGNRLSGHAGTAYASLLT